MTFSTAARRVGVVGFAVTLLAATTTIPIASAANGAAADVRLSGGSAAQRALMRQILAGMGPTHISAVRLQPPPRNLGDWPRTPNYLNVTASGGLSLADEWEVWLFRGAFGDLSVERRLPRIFRFSPRSDPPAATAAGAQALDEQVRQAVSSTAAGSDLQIVSLQILRPDGLAFALVLKTSNPAAYMKYQLRSLLEQTRGGQSRLDGTYIALEDASGAVVWAAAQSSRVGTGSGTAARELSGCDPVSYFGMMRAPPPCPAP